MTETLTDSERDVLTAAARRPDGRIHPLPEDVDADPIVGKLVSLDLIERVPDERPASEPLLRINYQGLKALHAGPDDRATAARPTAVEAFIAAKLEFDDLLERLRTRGTITSTSTPSGSIGVMSAPSTSTSPICARSATPSSRKANSPRSRPHGPPAPSGSARRGFGQ